MKRHYRLSSSLYGAATARMMTTGMAAVRNAMLIAAMSGRQMTRAMFTQLVLESIVTPAVLMAIKAGGHDFL